MAKAWSRRSRMTCLGDSGLPVAQAGHWDWQRPHSVQVPSVQQALPGEVLDLPQPEHVHIRVGFLEVQHLPVRPHRLQRAQRVGAAGEHDVDRREGDVQVLGVGDDHQERQHDPELGQDEHRLQDAVDPVAEGVQRPGDHPGRERPGRRVGEHPGVDLRPAVEQERGDDQEDHAEDNPCGPGVGAEEPRSAAFPVRVLAHPDDRERDDPGEHADGEQVLQEPGDRPVPDARDREGAREQVPVGLDDRQQQHDETPERGRVRRAGHRPLQQLPLPDNLDQLRLDLTAQVLFRVADPLRRRLPGHAQPLQPPQPPPGNRERHHRQPQANDYAQDHAEPPQYSGLKRSPGTNAGGGAHRGSRQSNSGAAAGMIQ